MPEKKSPGLRRVGHFGLQASAEGRERPHDCEFSSLWTGGGSVPFARGPAARKAVDLNAIDDHVRAFTPFELSSSRQPPFTPLQEQLLGAVARLGFVRILVNLFIPPECQHRRPAVLVADVLDFETHLWVPAHPQNLLSDGGERVDAVALRVEGKMNRDDVRLVEASTREAPKAGPAKDVATFVAIQFVDQHRCEWKCFRKYTWDLIEAVRWGTANCGRHAPPKAGFLQHTSARCVVNRAIGVLAVACDSREWIQLEP